MKKLLFVIGALITSTAQPFRPSFDIDDMDTRMPADGQERMDTAKTKDLPEQAMPARKPLRRPAHLTPMERSILDTFEYQLAPLADGLGSLTASPEARQAREAKLKEREARAKESLKHRSEDRRWWQPSDSPYRPSHRGGFSDFSGDGWRSPTSPRIPSYWTPPTTGSSDGDFGYSPTATSPSSSPSDSATSTTGQPGLTTSDGDDDDDDDRSDDGGSSSDKKGKGTLLADKGEGKEIGKGLSSAITALSSIATRIEKLDLTDAASDKTAKKLTDQHIIQKLDGAIEKADDAINGLSNEHKKAFKNKCDELEKQQKRVEQLYPTLLPHALHAATIPTPDAGTEKQQPGIKTFIEHRIKESAEVSVAAYNNALRTRQTELLAQMPKAAAPAGAVARSGGKAPAANERLDYIKQVLELMPTGRGDHPDAGRDNLIKQQHAIEAEIAAAEKKAAEEAPVPAVKAAAPVAMAPGDALKNPIIR
jgi:hypothetical protein